MFITCQTTLTNTILQVFWDLLSRPGCKNSPSSSQLHFRSNLDHSHDFFLIFLVTEIIAGLPSRLSRGGSWLGGFNHTSHQVKTFSLTPLRKLSIWWIWKEWGVFWETQCVYRLQIPYHAIIIPWSPSTWSWSPSTWSWSPSISPWCWCLQRHTLATAAILAGRALGCGVAR